MTNKDYEAIFGPIDEYLDVDYDTVAEELDLTELGRRVQVRSNILRNSYGFEFYGDALVAHNVSRRVKNLVSKFRHDRAVLRQRESEARKAELAAARVSVADAPF